MAFLVSPGDRLVAEPGGGYPAAMARASSSP
jgi:hypothetical protein